MAAAGRVTESEVDRHAPERAAVVGLALATLPNEDEVRDRFAKHHGTRFPSLGESLDHLRTLTTEDAHLAHRTIALRLLAKLTSRRGMEPLGKEADQVRGFLRTTMEVRDREWGHLAGHTRRPAERTPDRHPSLVNATPTRAVTDPDVDVQHALDGLDLAAQRRAPSWHSFAPESATALDLSEEEMALPRCNDQEGVPVGGHDSVRIATWFSSPKPAADFTRWTDPRTWDKDCSLFYEDIRLQEGEELAEDAQVFSKTFIEKVRISEDKLLTTPLTFTRTVVGPNLYALYFTMPPGTETDDLFVDTGSLVARADPSNPSVEQTLLFAEKCLRFKDPALRSWPTLLCDLYWMELTILAALGCRIKD
jgi:hypothetical protein